ncbi:hypothetical protein [Salimicrobium halophilum]|uniref:Uncharacterized protein n=1 Tax=Salimicrobium halophilum TaxID=86666 RepID=A0A1G8U818_9BACI|nr:hypothetical protein [Salimicrobium halophilum]SDJ49871.1 hypothetical protein SAMN04490247_2098 [Salimicrobium halophilum]
MSATTLLKWITGICEALLAIPIAGGAFILSGGWQPLLFMFVFHLIVLIISINQKQFSSGSVVGMIANAVGIIPIIGWIMHTITAIILIVDAGMSTAKKG